MLIKFAGAFLVVADVARAQTYPPLPVVKDGTSVLMQDYASAPLSGRFGSITNFGPNVNTNDQLARINFLRSEPADAPGSAARFFVNDLNRSLFILNKSTRSFSNYLNFQAVFRKFDNDSGFAGGLVTFAFDPAYASNGIFYTVHTEDPTIGGSAAASNTNLPGLNTNGYTTTAAINPPSGSTPRQAVLVEWKDTNITNQTFEGTARELMRVGFGSNIHPLGDMAFNPLAQPGDDDYRNLYLAVGDGGAGEITTNDSRHYIPQRLDSIQGKTLRITPDLNLHTGISTISPNTRYRIPSGGADPNPFVNTNGARGEIFTFGHRNPHRLSWDPVVNKLFVFEIGLSSFEEINIVHKGANYGYAEREGTKLLTPPGGNYSTAAPGYGLSDLPDPDTLPIRITNAPTTAMVPVHYPAAEYFQTEGDAMSCGFIYRGSLMPRLYGKCIFGDITTGRLFYCDAGEMVAADDADPATLATVHELQIVYENPRTNGGAINQRMFDIVADEFHFRGGSSSTNALTGSAEVTRGNDPDGIPYNRGRADIRLAMGGDGEVYVISKSDGLIRKLAAVVAPPIIESIVPSTGSVTLTWQSVIGRQYRVWYKPSFAESNWTALPGDVTATNSIASKTDVSTGTNRFYRIQVLP